MGYVWLRDSTPDREASLPVMMRGEERGVMAIVGLGGVPHEAMFGCLRNTAASQPADPPPQTPPLHKTPLEIRDFCLVVTLVGGSTP